MPLSSVHMSLPLGTGLRLMSATGFLLRIGMFAGIPNGTVTFHSSKSLYSLGANQPELSSAIPEAGIQTLTDGNVPRGGGWNEAFITHPHDPNCLDELELENYSVLSLQGKNMVYYFNHNF